MGCRGPGGRNEAMRRALAPTLLVASVLLREFQQDEQDNEDDGGHGDPSCVSAWRYLCAMMTQADVARRQRWLKPVPPGANAANAANAVADGIARARETVWTALPHLGCGCGQDGMGGRRVASYVGYVAKSLLVELAKSDEDGRQQGEADEADEFTSLFLHGWDKMEAKRISFAGDLLEDLMRKSLQMARVGLSRLLRNKTNGATSSAVLMRWSKKTSNRDDNITKILSDSVDFFTSAIRTGSWPQGLPYRRSPWGKGGAEEEGRWGYKAAGGGGGGVKAKLPPPPLLGVSQEVAMDNPMATLSHLRRLVASCAHSPSLSQIKDERLVDPDSIFLICPYETPDGSDIGLKKNLAMAAGTSLRKVGVHAEFFAYSTALVADVGSAFHQHSTSSDIGCRILVDGAIVGVTSPCVTADVAAICLRKHRRHSEVVREYHEAAVSVKVVRDALCDGIDEVRVCTDAGRLVHPLAVVRPLSSSPPPGSWIEYLEKDEAFLCDAAEMASADMAVRWDSASDPPPRRRRRTCQIPVPQAYRGVAASLIPYANHNQAPRQMFAANMSKQALCGSSNGRGDVITPSHTLSYVQHPLVSSVMSVHLPTPMYACQGVNVMVMVIAYGYNQEDAIMINASSLERGVLATYQIKSFVDVVRGKKDAKKSRALDGRTEVPVGSLKKGDRVEGLPTDLDPLRGQVLATDIFKITKTTGEEGHDFTAYRTTLGTYRPVGQGDKFASRHGQKGCVGIQVAEVDMPFAECGLKPDILINPHGFPSRMTEGQHIEGVSALAACEAGEIPPPSSRPFDEVCANLVEAGFRPEGQLQRIYRGDTGEQMTCQTMIAPMYYMRLLHIASNKVRVRGSHGPVDSLTQQPTRGRNNGGGLRNGYMEVDNMVAQGAVEVMKDRLVDQADPYSLPVDALTGRMEYDVVPPEGMEMSQRCGDGLPSTVNVKIPYSMKLTAQMAMAMGVRMNFDVHQNKKM